MSEKQQGWKRYSGYATQLLLEIKHFIKTNIWNMSELNDLQLLYLTQNFHSNHRIKF